MKIERIELQRHGDERGMLVALSSSTRTFHLESSACSIFFATEGGVHRGLHAHRKARQLAIAVGGSVKFRLDHGGDRLDVLLDDPAKGLLFGTMVWVEMFDFSADCVLMVLSDQLYDADDYVRDYAAFCRLAKGKPIDAQAARLDWRG